MDIKNLDAVPSFITKDSSEIRELLAQAGEPDTTNYMLDRLEQDRNERMLRSIGS